MVFKILLSGLTAVFLIFFISALGGTDLKKNSDMIKDLEKMFNEINTELEVGIDKRIKGLGEVPQINPYKKYYCAEFAKEIHDISYLAEKQKIMFDAFNVRDFEYKAQQLIKYADTADMAALFKELEIVKRELKNSANLIASKQRTLLRQRTAYIVFSFCCGSWFICFIVGALSEDRCLQWSGPATTGIETRAESMYYLFNLLTAVCGSCFHC